MAEKRKRKSDFGEYLTKLIKDAGMSQFDFYSEVGIAKPYFYDILSGRTSPPPQDTLERMVCVLEKQLPSHEKCRTELFNRAAIGRDEIPCDIKKMIKEHPECWDNLRKTLYDMITSHS